MPLSTPPFTVTQATKLLRVPQHRLIHLCEEEVIVPELGDTRGRGSSRRFSERNLYEFAIALEMRRLEIPVSFVRAVLHVLRTFEAEVRRTTRDFALPQSIRPVGAPQLSLFIIDGERLYFALRGPKSAQLIFGGVEIPRPSVSGRARHHRPAGRLRRLRGQALPRLARTRVEIDLSAIARDLDVSKG